MLHALGDHLLVGDDRFHAIGALDHRVARLDRGHLSAPAVDGHHVADPQAPVEQHDEAAHVVARDLLQAEAKAHAERAAEDGKRGDVDARHRQRDEDGHEQHRDAHYLGDHHARGHLHVLRGEHAAFRDAREVEGEDDGEEERRDALQEVEEGDLGPARAEPEAVRIERGQHLGREAGHVEDGGDPRHPVDDANDRALEAALVDHVAEHIGREADRGVGHEQRERHVEEIHRLETFQDALARPDEDEREHGERHALEIPLSELPLGAHIDLAEGALRDEPGERAAAEGDRRLVEELGGGCLAGHGFDHAREGGNVDIQGHGMDSPRWYSKLPTKRSVMPRLPEITTTFSAFRDCAAWVKL